MVLQEPPIVRRIRESVVGDGGGLPGPFGIKPLVYADHTASGRVLGFVEDHIRAHVMPWYANTHTEASATGRRMTALREEARRSVHAAVGAGDEHVVIFCGSGSTAAIDKFVRILAGARGPRPLVFVGPYEHHSNELPWRESGAEVVRIGAGRDGGIDAAELAERLGAAHGRETVVGAFSAGSNVTGVRADADALSDLLHRHGALACWDYAAAGPHGDIHAAGDGRHPLGYRDAVFLSPHKFPGGPGTPGVLVVRRDLVRNPVPTVPGGGTVAYVHPGAAHYLADVAHREEGGTPAIIESIRAGLVLGLHRSVGAGVVRAREDGYVRRALDSWRQNPAITILGDENGENGVRDASRERDASGVRGERRERGERLPIVSFTVRGLHHNLAVTLLSDLFGIQARGGCSCAGPYGHELLGITPREAERLAARAVAGRLGVKPGWARVSFAYYLAEAEFTYIVEAVHLVAAYGARLQERYHFDDESGMWWHRDAVVNSGFAGLLEVPNPDFPLLLAQARALLGADGGLRGAGTMDGVSSGG